ncbi:MAG: hypothetical protein Q9160_002630 [Pyrenula sp. 1 TL-2023]
MASSQKPRQGSRWGGFLQQAVASVESRLDTILAEEDEASPAARNALNEQKDGLKRAPVSPSRRPEAKSEDLSRSSSNAKAHDRLQERLARAMVNQNSPGRPSSPVSSIASASRSQTPYADLEDESVEGSNSTTGENLNSGDSELPAPRLSVDEVDDPGATEHSQLQSSETLGTTGGLEGVQSPPIRRSQDSDESRPISIVQDIPQLTINGAVGSESGDLADVKEVGEIGEMEKQWQEESRDYIERIDALQSKLQYLAKEAAESAKNAANAAKAGSLEKKVNEKDEKIALLMGEGQQLSQKEMTHLSTIRRMRAQALDTEKLQSSTLKRAEAAERDLVRLDERARRAETSNRRAEEKLRSTSQSDKDIAALSRERDALNATVAEIKRQLQRAVNRAEAADAKAQNDALDKERRRVTELQDDLTSSRIEKELSDEKFRREIRDLKAVIEREKDHSRVLESELRGEQSVLESKMESLRTRAEEASSNAKGDVQAKLLRQVETLQSQYSLASENWHGIENSLLARLAAVEKERDEIAQREADIRRKLRETNSKLKKAEAEIGASQEIIQDLEQKATEKEHEVKALNQRSEQLGRRCEEIEQDSAKQQQESECAYSQRLAEERRKWLESLQPSSGPASQRNESPAASFRKVSGLGLDYISSPAADRPASRRTSTFSPQTVDNNLPFRQGAFPSFDRSPMMGQVPETPSIHSNENEDLFSNGAKTPASPNRGVNELMSVSTVGAGPSVQLVERMSASVRRLESERAASKDELARLTAQRDEARREVVALVKEVELKRNLGQNIQALEKEHNALDARYQATLEMLGEKSEQVDELQADVADVKQMYRDLVDRTMK